MPVAAVIDAPAFAPVMTMFELLLLPPMPSRLPADTIVIASGPVAALEIFVTSRLPAVVVIPTAPGTTTLSICVSPARAADNQTPSVVDAASINSRFAGEGAAGRGADKVIGSDDEPIAPAAARLTEICGIPQGGVVHAPPKTKFTWPSPLPVMSVCEFREIATPAPGERSLSTLPSMIPPVVVVRITVLGVRMLLPGSMTIEAAVRLIGLLLITGVPDVTVMILLASS